MIVHIGTNDISYQKSELLKSNFVELLELLGDCGKSVFISGPIPTLGHGIGSFSRLLSLHTWLQSECATHNVCYIDNFNLFWERASFYNRDGLHPNSLGARRLASNIFHALIVGR